MSNKRYIAKTFKGLEDVLVKELNEIGIEDCTILNRSVAFDCSFEKMMEANLTVRTALRIYHPILAFDIRDEQDLYEQLLEYEWDNWLGLEKTFAIESIVTSQQFHNSHFISLKSKDGIVDFFYKKYGRRPDVDVRFPDIRIQIHISSLNRCTVSIDTSGEALYKRGYKKRQTEASINECLAAGMILLTDWRGETDFYDPMCGAGTLFIEAALIASKVPANINREKWSFFQFKDFDKNIYESLRTKLKAAIKISTVNYYVNDNSSQAMDIAKMNYYNTRVDLPYIKFTKENFFQMSSNSKSGMMVINPPYNERLELKEDEMWYKDMGDTMKNHFKGFSIWVISSNKNAFRKIGLKDSERYHLLNGALPCEYCKYEIF